MTLKFGTYTLLNGIILKLIPLNSEFKLVFTGEKCTLNNFKESKKGIFVSILPKNKISNAFFIQTKCVFKNEVFDLHQLNNNRFLIVTDKLDLKEKLKLNTRERSVYDLEVNLSELSKIWEERKPSNLGLPFPEGIKEYEEIEIHGK